MSERQRLRRGDTDQLARIREIEARALRLVQAGTPWLTALSEAYREVPQDPRRRAPGKVAKTASLAPQTVHRTAEEGVADAGGELPYLEEIQAAFGPAYDLSEVRAHVGGPAAKAAERAGAEAYAMGQDIAFQQSPDLRLAAHEAAHVVQQRAGVQLQGGVGRAGDEYERHADRVADAVVQGRSAAGLLGELGRVPVASPRAAYAVQMQDAAGAAAGGGNTPEIGGGGAQTILIGNEQAVSLYINNDTGADYTWDVEVPEGLEASFSGSGQSNTLNVTARAVGEYTLTAKVTESTTSTIGYLDISVKVPEVSVSSHESFYTQGPYGKDVMRIEGSFLVAGDTAEMVMALENVDDIHAANIAGDLNAKGQASAETGELTALGSEATGSLLMDKEGLAALDPVFDVPGQGELAYTGDNIEVVDDPDAFMARSYPARECAGVGGEGGFLAALNQGTLEITVKCAVVAKPGLTFDGETVTASHGNPTITPLIKAMHEAMAVQKAELDGPYEAEARKNLETVKSEIRSLISSQFTWATGAPELAKAREELMSSLSEWGGQHTFASGRRGWEKVQVSVQVKGDVAIVDGSNPAPAGTHVTVELVKLPKGPVTFLGKKGSVSGQPSTTQFDTSKLTDAELDELTRMTPDDRKAWLEKRGIADTHDQQLQIDVATGDDPMDWNAWKNDRNMMSAPVSFEDGTSNLAGTPPDLSNLKSGTTASAQKPPITVSASANTSNLAKERVTALVSYASGQLPGNKIVAGAANVHAAPETPDVGPGVLQVGGGGKQDIFKHELGHAAFGLGDAYPEKGRRDRNVDAETEHHQLAQEMGAGGATVEMNDDVMSAGNKVSKADYAAFYKALSEITEYPWKIS